MSLSQVICLCLQVYVLMSMSLCHHFSSYSHGTLSYVSMSPSQVVRLCPQVLSYMSMSLCHHIHTVIQVMYLCLQVYVPMSPYIHTVIQVM